MPRSNSDASEQGIFGGRGWGILGGMGAGAATNIGMGIAMNRTIRNSEGGTAALETLHRNMGSGTMGIKDAIKESTRISREHGGRLGKFYGSKYGKFAGIGAVAAGAVIGGMMDNPDNG